MSLDELEAQGPRGHKVDKVQIAYDELSEAKRETFKRLLDNEQFSAPQIATALQNEGFDVNKNQVVHFRAKIKEGKVVL